jgi:hypothetical protein
MQFELVDLKTVSRNWIHWGISLVKYASSILCADASLCVPIQYCPADYIAATVSGSKKCKSMIIHQGYGGLETYDYRQGAQVRRKEDRFQGQVLDWNQAVQVSSERAGLVIPWPSTSPAKLHPVVAVQKSIIPQGQGNCMSAQLSSFFK